jgi:hypothetical protein
MATTTIEARCNARPTRLVFILANADRGQLLSVISRATTLWGGRFNPIVILDDAGRTMVGRHYTLAAPEPHLKLQADLLKAFDPDLLINYSGNPLPPELSTWAHLTFPADQLDWNPTGSAAARSYFVDIRPLLDDLWEKEFRNVATPRFKLRFIEKAEAEASPMLAARFGLYPTEDYYEFLKRNFGAAALTYNAELRGAHWPGDFQTPLGFTGIYCQARRQIVDSHAFFLLNPDDPFDLVDYWNLRASGKIVFPLTLHDYKDCATPISDFAAVASYPGRALGFLTIIKAASITDEQIEEVRQWITVEGLSKAPVGTMGWVPQYHRGNYGAADELEIEQLTCFESNNVGVLVDGYGRIDGAKPAFLKQGDYFSHWSMDLSLPTFRDPKGCYRLPWLNSGCDGLVARHIGFSSQMDASRVSRTGIVTRHDGDSSHVRISPITAVQAVKAFLEGVGVTYRETSAPGLALTRIVEMMGTLHTCEVFQNSAIRDTLDEMSRGDPRTVHSVKIAIVLALKDLNFFGSPLSEKKKHEHSERLMKRAIDAKVFRVGLVFQCSVCHKRSWYPTTEFSDTYTCKNCFSQEPTPYVHELEWYFAADGLFRSSNKLDGNITVLLALSFFNEIYKYDGLQYAPSFLYELGGEPREMDFAVIAADSHRSGVDMIFGEAKSGAALDVAEREKLRAFGLQTSAYICFCTLAEEFDVADKEYFKELYEAGVKIIMLPKLFLEMESFELSDFVSKNNPGRSPTEADWLMRFTTIRTLGEEFAKKHYIWV